MSQQRRLRILAELAASGPDDVTPGRLCEVTRHVTGVTGAAITLFANDTPVGSACTAGPLSALVEELEFTLGEGPCVDAYRHDRPVLEPDLANPASPGWVAFIGPALDAGVRAIFGFPVGVGSARVGSLNLYVDRPGSLTDDQHADALVMANVAAEVLLGLQAEGPADVLAPVLDEDSNFHYVVHQAAGMLSAQLEVGLAQALVRLRAYSFAAQRPITEVAKEVVDRRLRLSDAEG